MPKQPTSLNLRLGLQGWPHPEWIGNYFPADLPTDWRFSYYANEASCLLLTNDDLSNSNPNEIQDWLDDAPEQFCLYLQHTDWEHQSIRMVTPISDHGWLVEGTGGYLITLPYTSNLRTLRTELEKLPDNLEALVFTGDVNPRQLHEIRILIELLS